MNGDIEAVELGERTGGRVSDVTIGSDVTTENHANFFRPSARRIFSAKGEKSY